MKNRPGLLPPWPAGGEVSGAGKSVGFQGKEDASPPSGKTSTCPLYWSIPKGLAQYIVLYS